MTSEGKTVLPGFIDGHGHLEDFHGELYLHLGITTCANIELYQDGPWTLAQKQGTDLGKIRGPRIWMSGRAIGGVSTGHDAFGSRTARDNIIVTTAEEVRKAVQRKKELGCEILKVNEFLSLDLLKVAVDEAHGLGMPVAAHSWDVVGSVNAGVDAIEHIWSVGYSSIPYAPARRKLAEDRLGGVIDQELAGAYYQTENFDAVIGAMVEHHVAWTPTIAKWLRPLSPSAERFRERENQILNNPNADLPAAVRAVTDNAYDKLLKRYTPAQLEQAKVGYEKAKEFIRRFVQAGGILKEGSDPPRGMAALLMHQALAIDVEAGVPPMTAIQAATLNVARTFRKDKDYGSVEPGKVADLSIVEGDPLQDIWMTQNVKMVVMDGKVIDIGFHKIQESDSVILFLPELAAGPRNIAALSHRGIRSHGIESKRAGRNVAIPPGHAERRAAADQFQLEGRASGDHSTRGDSNGGHIHRHAQVRRRSVPRVPSRPSRGGL